MWVTCRAAEPLLPSRSASWGGSRVGLVCVPLLRLASWGGLRSAAVCRESVWFAFRVLWNALFANACVRSMRVYNHVWSILRRRCSTHVWCPDVIGRDIWDWVEREALRCLEKKTPPEWGVYPNWWNSSSVLWNDCCCCWMLLFLNNNYCWAPSGPAHGESLVIYNTFAARKRMARLSGRVPKWVFCCCSLVSSMKPKCIDFLFFYFLDFWCFFNVTFLTNRWITKILNFHPKSALFSEKNVFHRRNVHPNLHSFLGRSFFMSKKAPNIGHFGVLFIGASAPVNSFCFFSIHRYKCACE